MRSVGADYAELERRGIRLAVVDLAVRYLGPARFDDQLELTVRLTDLGKATATFRYTLRDAGGQVLVEGHTRLGCLDEMGRPRRLPTDTWNTLERGRLAAPGASEES